MSKNTTAEAAFQSKLDEVRTQNLEQLTATRLRSDVAINDQLTRESVNELTQVLVKISENLNLDTEKIQNSIKMSRHSEYGRIPELLSKIASIYAWPVMSITDVDMIADNQEAILEILNAATTSNQITEDLLLDIKESKGFHSFMDQEKFVVVEGTEPSYAEFEYFTTTLADYLGLPIVVTKLTEEKWAKNERKALAKVAGETAAAEEALEAHKAMKSA